MGKRKKKSEISNKKVLKKRTNPLGIGFFVIPLIVLIFLYAIIISATEDWKCFYISPVFKNYEPLDKNDSADKELESFFTDEAGLFYDEERFSLINDSAKYFYEKTGVKIYLYTVGVSEDGKGGYLYPSDEEMKETCENVCKELSPEGIDLVVLFLSTPEGYRSCTYATDEVRNNFGKKCEKIIEQYLVYNFNVVGEYDELFWATYRNSADRLMGGFTSPLSMLKENLRVVILSVLTLIIVCSSIVFYIFMGKKQIFIVRK
ncbi:MAG: hypothetical protein E7614_00910 [Ruminococcaceae bacterium]|nr:hypothetical protein [Oscillospiraceae bacterium]